ncbi:hypothetical protein PMZ80_001320 [Knufia obscura]|uniref:GMC oxidoreductase n=1 Tax=Knufia obscura TaxID=1635080 RepID=A0ABR0S2V6_9EURO|nr:hypothetical protein PMZ80_001320 [Knufia obscura]
MKSVQCILAFASLALSVPILTEVQLPTLLGNSFGVPGVNTTYDYVVVGGGTAGLTIAARLAQNNSVAVVEAGGFYQIDNGNGSTIPALCVTQYVGADPSDTQPLIDWGFVTTPQAGAANRSLHYARGKTLGGSSARNYLAYHRPTVESMDRWATEVGDDSYGWDNVLPFYKKSPHLTLLNTDLRPSNSSVQYDPTAFDNSAGGPLQVSWPNYADAINTWAELGLGAVGVPPNPENFNSGNLTGSAWNPSTLNADSQERETSQTSFLAQAIRQTDIKVYKQSLAKQIIFDSSKTATGVLIDTMGQEYTLTATKEVVLSAGVFQSPQLLMVSGVGPRATLEQFNIPVLSDLPGVGQNMWDHIKFGPAYRVNVLTSSESLNNPVYAELTAQEYLQNRTGPLTVPPGMIAWEKLSSNPAVNWSRSTLDALAEFPFDWPEMEYLIENGFAGDNQNYMMADPKDGYNYATVSAALVAPLSRGNVSIESSDMADAPIINPNWLTHPADIDVAVAAFKRVRQVFENMSNVTIGEEYYPGLNVSTDAEITQFIRQTVIQLYHAAGTCKMGPKNDSMAVVDTESRVYGVQSLRVVDASAFPFLPPGHPQSTVYMLAEKITENMNRR